MIAQCSCIAPPICESRHLCSFTGLCFSTSPSPKRSATCTRFGSPTRFGADLFEMNLRITNPWPNKSRGCVKTVSSRFGNDQFFDMKSFVEMSRRIQWSRNEFSHRLSPEPAAVGAGCHRATGSAVASVKPRGATPLYGVHAASRRRLSFFR